MKQESGSLILHQPLLNSAFFKMGICYNVFQFYFLGYKGVFILTEGSITSSIKPQKIAFKSLECHT